MARRGFGQVRKLPSGRWQASYVGPDGQRHNAPQTFQAKTDAAGWLAAPADRHRTRHLGQASPGPAAAAPTFAEYAARVIEHRASNGLRPSTERKYRGELAGHLAPAFGATRIDQVTVAQVNEWFASYGRRAPLGAGERLPAADHGDEDRDR